MVRSPLVKLKKKSVNIRPEEEKWDDNGNEEEVYDDFLSDWIDGPTEHGLPLGLPVSSESWCDICEEDTTDTVYRLTPNVNICRRCLSGGTP